MVYFVAVMVCGRHGIGPPELETLTAHSIMRNRFQINPDISETGFGFSGFLHSIGENETGFTKPLKPGREMVSLTKPEIVHVCTLSYLLSSSLKLRLKVTYTYSTRSRLY